MTENLYTKMTLEELASELVGKTFTGGAYVNDDRDIVISHSLAVEILTTMEQNGI